MIVKPFCENKLDARMPPAKLEVAFVPCTSTCPTMTVEVAPPVPVTKRPPAMPSAAEGEVEPMPTLP